VTVPVVAESRFLLKDLVLDGASAYHNGRDLRPLYQKYLNTQITKATLTEIAALVTKKYAADGYAFCRAVAPGKTGADGIARIHVVESRLGRTLAPKSIAGSRLDALTAALVGQRPLRRAALDKLLDQAARMPGASLAGSFRDSADRPGAVDVVFHGVEAAGPRSIGVAGAHLSAQLPLPSAALPALTAALSVGGAMTLDDGVARLPSAVASPVVASPTVSAPAQSAGAQAGQILLAAANDAPPPFVRPPSSLMPGQDRPIPEASPPANLDFTIQAPRRSPVPRAVEELMFEVKDIKITGVTAYSAEQFKELTAPMAGQTVHLADLISLAEKIEGKYREDGFVLTRAYVPTQSVGDGVFQINVIEGYVAAASVNGGDDSARERIEELLAPVLASKPLALPVIERALLSANEIPGISASGLLRPSGSEPGASDLVVTVRQAPFSSSLSFDNSGSRSSNPITLAADASFASPLDDGGVVSLSASTAPRLQQRGSISMRYVVPTMVPGVNATFSALASHGEPAGSIAPLKLVSDSTAFGARLSYNLLVSRDNKISADGGITVQSANVTILETPYSHDEWRVADLALSFQDSRFLDGITSLTTSVAQGLPMAGASSSGSPRISRSMLGHTDFTKVNAIFRRIQPVDQSLSFSFSANGQYAFCPLLTGEEVSFGGPGVGRGYDPGATSGDSGIGGSMEMRYDLDPADIYADWAQFYTFYDAGATWVRSGRATDNRVRSAGFGMRTMYFSNMSVNLEFGHVLDPMPSSDFNHRTSRLVVSGSIRF